MQFFVEMLANYDELCFKSVAYPVAIMLDDLADNFANLNCQDNVSTLERFIELNRKLKRVTKTADDKIKELLGDFGYKLLELDKEEQ